MHTKDTRIKQKGDFLLVIMVLILLIWGILMVFSASFYSQISKTGDPFSYLKADVRWAILGIVLMFITAVIDYRAYKKLAPVFLGISLLLLLLLFTPLGHASHNAVRWIQVGSITIMPGEIAKLSIIIFSAAFLSGKKERLHNPLKGLFPLLFVALVFFALIYKQPNLSTALIVVGIVFLMMFVSGINPLQLFAVGITGSALLLAYLFNKGGEHVNRLTSFIDPFEHPTTEGYQAVQSLLSLGSGGLTGRGFGHSIQKNLYLPEPQNDFIFSILGEELGFIGVLVLFVCYFILIWKCFQIAFHARDMFGMLLASGISILLSLQVAMNIAVVTSSMPLTGVTLPLISYGGNALLLFMASFGIMINISRQSKKEEES